LIKPHFPAICSAIPFGPEAVWCLDDGKLLNWLADRVARLIPVLSRSNPIEEYLLVEVAWDIIRHYIRADLAKRLKAKLQELFPRSFPRASPPVFLEPENPVESVPAPPPKNPKLLPKGTPQAPKKPTKVAARGIDAFFAPQKK
jgi:hypothetical protein